LNRIHTRRRTLCVRFAESNATGAILRPLAGLSDPFPPNPQQIIRRTSVEMRRKVSESKIAQWPAKVQLH
jgi:hypothetical protein